MSRRLLRIETLAVIAAALILTFILMLEPIIGIADNGDFQRIMASTGLGYLGESNRDKYFGFIERLYSVNDIPLTLKGFYISTEIFLVKFAIFLNRLVKDNGIFDIRFLSIIYSVIFLFSIYLILKYSRPKSILTGLFLAFLLIAFFTDVGYISYFNSLYGESVSFTFLLLTIGTALCLVRLEKPSVWVLAGFFTASLFLIGAKVQNVLIAAVIILFGIRLRQIRKDRLWRNTLLICVLLLSLSSAVIYLSVPKGIKDCNKYQTVFYGILKDSPNPSKDLQELGLDPKFSVLAGTNFFMKDLPYNLKDPAMEKELYDKISRGKILAFYIRHPLRYAEKLEKTANSAFTVRQEGFGNYEKAENTRFGQMSNSFGVWSSVKNSIIPHSLLFVVIFYILYLGILAMLHIRAKGNSCKAYIEVFMVIALIGLIQFLVPVLGDGEADLSKHLFLFNVSFDMMLISGMSWSAGKSLELGKKILKERPFRIKFI